MCSKENFRILSDALAKAAEENKIPELEFIAFIYEFPRVLFGENYDKIVYVKNEKNEKKE